jgi:hypothetical protein
MTHAGIRLVVEEGHIEDLAADTKAEAAAFCQN